MDNLIYIDEISIDKCIIILNERFKNKKIYTGLGAVLLSINPYEYFTGKDNIYSLENKDSVHLFRTMEKVYNGMIDGENQTIIVSGESGSGKTETVKQIIHYLSNYSSVNNLLEKIEASCLVLEIFGNASTEKNHNSSRFGKFIELYYKNKICVGMTTSVYLLEKPRVLCKDTIGKFHVFNRDNIEIKFVLEKAGFSNQQIDFVIKIVELVREIIELEYGTSYNPIYKELLTKKNMNIQDEQIEKIYNELEFKELRDNLAMKLYEFLFLWLVEQMNIFYKTVETTNLLKIGILDIFGFENLKKNSLEQLCINYANEILQGLLNKILIEDKMKLYKEEAISIESIIPVLNYEQIDLIERIFITLDEECMLPKGNSRGFIQKLNLLFTTNPFYSTQKVSLEKCFEIEHYAGKIEYNVSQFLQSNQDRLNLDIDNFIGNLFLEVGLNNKKKRGVGKLKIHSITNQFKNNLDEFLQNVKKSNLHFIKCIKPNNNEKPMEFISSIVKEQLVYNGVIQLITIFKQGYSYHFSRDTFYNQYGDYVLDSDKDYIIGKSRIFLTEEYYKTIKYRYHLKRIESLLILQKYSRCIIQINKYNHIKIALLQLENTLWSRLLQNDYHMNRSAFRIQRFFKYIQSKLEIQKKQAGQIICNYVKGKCLAYQYIRFTNKIYKLLGILKKNSNVSTYLKIKNATIKIQLWWKNYMMKKNDLKKQNKYLEEQVYQRDRKIIMMEHRILELERRLSRSLILDKNIIHERDHNIISLKKDIECYQKNIAERLRDKLDLMEIIDKLKIENRILVHQISYLKNKNDLGWITRFFK
jgi:hypothetical protein